MEKNSINLKTEEPGSLKSYVVGFLLSLTLTLVAYFLVTEHLLTNWPLALALAGLATTQVVIQLLLFLHLGKESTPPWNFIVFLFMLLIVAILVLGTLWVMYNLDYHMMAT